MTTERIQSPWWGSWTLGPLALSPSGSFTFPVPGGRVGWLVDIMQKGGTHRQCGGCDRLRLFERFLVTGLGPQSVLSSSEEPLFPVLDLRHRQPVLPSRLSSGRLATPPPKGWSPPRTR